MPELFGRSFSRAELLRRIGHLSQIGGVQLVSSEAGASRGVQSLEFRTGTGLIFKVALDRGMDVGYCEFRGRSLAWIPPSQLPAPWFFGEQTSFGWLRSALGGLLNTCGLVHIGNPGSADVEHYNFPARRIAEYGVHDRIAQSPARLLEYGERWEGDACCIEALAEVLQAQTFGENLRLRRRYRAWMGESRFTIQDEVVNLGFTPTRHMLLYHINLGFPYVQEGAEVVLPAKQGSTPKVLAGDVGEQGTDWRHVIEPTRDWKLQVFEHRNACAADGTAYAGILQTDPSGDYCEGVYLSYTAEQLPVFLETRMMGEGFYSVILEPATNGLDAEAQEAAGDRIWLQPGEKRGYALEIGILEDAAACSAFLQRLAHLQ